VQHAATSPRSILGRFILIIGIVKEPPRMPLLVSGRSIAGRGRGTTCCLGIHRRPHV
jgi:hypothetical protein